MKAKSTAPQGGKAVRAVKCAVCVILALLLCMNVLMLLMRNQQGLDTIDRLPFAMIEVTGGSMEPELHDGEVVLAVQTPYEELEIGDTVIFSRNNELIIHKIRDRNDSELITRGTANAMDDEPVTKQDYRARMICRLPGLGALWEVCGSPLRFAIFAVLAVLLIFGNDIFSALYTLLFEKKH